MNRSKMRPGSPVDWFHHQLMSRLNPSKRKATMVHEVMVRSVDGDVTAVRSLANRGVDDPNSFHRAMRPIVRVAQVFGHIPVEGVGGTNADTLRFKWGSFKVIYCLFCIVGGVFMLGVHSCDLVIHQGSKSFARSSVVLFCLVANLNLSFCLILANKWPSLLRKIQNLEVAMKPNYGYPKNLSRNLKIVTYPILLASLAEHSVSRFKEIVQAMECSDSTVEWIQIYFCGTNTIIFTYLVHYNIIVVALLEHARYVAVFSWNFMDIIVIVFSIMLTSRLRQVTARLKATRHKMPERFWRQIREDYNELSKLVKLVDEHINKIILLTFGNNLYFICLQLLLSMQKELASAHSIYFYTSFVHLCLRSTAMCLIAASIHGESQEPKTILLYVPSESFSNEVQRFITQVSTDTVALTGLKFFSVTKMMLLTLVGTIVTYEIVLLQFEEDSGNIIDKTVVNPFCPNKTSS